MQWLKAAACHDWGGHGTAVRKWCVQWDNAAHGPSNGLGIPLFGYRKLEDRGKIGNAVDSTWM